MRFVNIYSVLKLTFILIYRRGVITTYTGSGSEIHQSLWRNRRVERTGDPTTDQLRHRRHLTAANCGPNRGPVASSAASGHGAKETDPIGYRSQTRWFAFSVIPLTCRFVDYLPHCYEWFLHNTNLIFFPFKIIQKVFIISKIKAKLPIIANKTNIRPVIWSLLV